MLTHSARCPLLIPSSPFLLPLLFPFPLSSIPSFPSFLILFSLPPPFHFPLLSPSPFSLSLFSLSPLSILPPTGTSLSWTARETQHGTASTTCTSGYFVFSSHLEKNFRAHLDTPSTHVSGHHGNKAIASYNMYFFRVFLGD